MNQAARFVCMALFSAALASLPRTTPITSTSLLLDASLAAPVSELHKYVCVGRPWSRSSSATMYGSARCG